MIITTLSNQFFVNMDISHITIFDLDSTTELKIDILDSPESPESLIPTMTI